MGRIYQQTFLDTYAKVACAKLYDRKNALVAADLLNDRVLPFFEEHQIAQSAWQGYPHQCATLQPGAGGKVLILSLGPTK